MRDEDADLLGMPSDEVKADQRADAAAEHEGRLVAESDQKMMCVLAVRRDLHISDIGVDRAARQPSTVVRDDGVAVEKLVAESIGGIGVTVSPG